MNWNARLPFHAYNVHRKILEKQKEAFDYDRINTEYINDLLLQNRPIEQDKGVQDDFVFSNISLSLVPATKNVAKGCLPEHSTVQHLHNALKLGRHVVVIGSLPEPHSYIQPCLESFKSSKVPPKAASLSWPGIVVLCSSWEKVEYVQDRVQMVVARSEFSHLRLFAAYGIEISHYHMVQMEKGANIVIATVQYLDLLLRTTSDFLINLKDLKHVIIEEIDDLLIKCAPKVLSVVKRMRRSSDFSLVATAHKFTPEVADFASKYDMGLLINSVFEAAIYKGLPLRLHHYTADDKLDVINDICESDEKTTVIVVSDNFSSRAKEIFDFIRTKHKRRVALVNGKSDIYELVNYCKLIITTEINLSRIVHKDSFFRRIIFVDVDYDCIGQFEKQLHCLASTIQDPKMSLPTVHLMIGCQNVLLIPDLIDLSKRIKNSTVPAQFNELLNSHFQETAVLLKCKSKPLCPNLASIGICDKMLDNRCNNRHTVVSKLDLPNFRLPHVGTVTVKVLEVVTATHFLVRVLRQRDLDGEEKDSEMVGLHERITERVQRTYADRNNRVLLEGTKMLPGKPCVVLFKGQYYRAIILQREKNRLKVRLVDEGFLVNVEEAGCFKIADRVKRTLFSATEVRAVNLKPVEDFGGYNRNATRFVSDLVRGQILEGKVVLCLGNTLWMQNLSKRSEVMRQHLDVRNSEYELGDILLSKKFALTNNDHLKKLRELCAFKCNLALNGTCSKTLKYLEKTDRETFAKCAITKVYATFIESPGRFHVQRHDKNSRFLDLAPRIKDYVNKRRNMYDLERPFYPNWREGQLCLAQFNNADDEYFRAEIQQISVDLSKGLKSLEIAVYYIDFGDESVVSADQLFPISKELVTALPAQAIPCSLYGVAPVADDWDQRCKQLMKNWTLNDQNLYRELDAKVFEEELDEYGCHSYVVNLYATEIESGTFHSLSFDLCDKGYVQTPNLDDLKADLMNTQYKLKEPEPTRDEYDYCSSDSEDDLLADLGSVRVSDKQLITDKLVDLSEETFEQNGGNVARPFVEADLIGDCDLPRIQANVIWYDSKKSVHLTVLLRTEDTRSKFWCADGRHFHYRGVVDGDNVLFVDMDLRDEVSPKITYSQIGLRAYFGLIKRKPIVWPNLLADSTKVRWLNYDCASLTVDDSSDEFCYVPVSDGPSIAHVQRNDDCGTLSDLDNDFEENDVEANMPADGRSDSESSDSSFDADGNTSYKFN